MQTMQNCWPTGDPPQSVAYFSVEIWCHAEVKSKI